LAWREELNVRLFIFMGAGILEVSSGLPSF